MHKPKNPLLRLALLLLALLNFVPQFSTAFAQGTAFTYNGLIQNGSSAQSGTFNFRFTLYNAEINGMAIAGPVTTNGVPVKNGAFTVTMDFGAAVWNGQTVWLQIDVQGNGDPGLIPLSPRQQVMPTPYAIYAESANNLSTTLSFSQITGTINNSQLANSSITINAGPGLSSGANPVALGGMISLTNTGVTSLTGSDGITVSAATGNVTLGLGSTLTLPNAPITINSGNNLLMYADNTHNYFAGLGAGNTTVSGPGNTGLGYLALSQNTEGNGNTAVGTSALSANTGGDDNTAVGQGALSGNTYGAGNTAVGNNALQVNDNVANTAVGWNSLGNNTGAGNTAVGNSSLSDNASGYENAAFGDHALALNTQGNGSTAIGGAALQADTSGTGNTAVGYRSSQFNVLGNQNVALGYNALGSPTNGSYNVAVGYGALNSLGAAPNVSGGSNNIAVGFMSGANFNANESSNIDIGSLGVTGDNNITRIGTPGIQTTAYIAGIITGDGSGLINLNASQITSGTINNSQLANSSIIVNTANGLRAAGSPVPLGGTITLTNTGVTSLTGGDGVTVSAATGDVTLGLGSTLTLGSFPVSMTSLGTPLTYVDGIGNYFAGFDAGTPSISASDNTAVGHSALHLNLNGSYNAAYGGYALSQNQSGTYNSAVGYNALEGNLSGSFNAAEGVLALSANMGGANNTAIGSYALSGLGASTFNEGGTNNIALGYMAGSDFTGNESSNIDIGNLGVPGDNNITRIGTPGIQTAAYIAGIINGNGSGLTSLNASQITSGTINSTLLANSPITIMTGNGITGGKAVPLGGSITLGTTETSLNTPNTIVSRDGTGSFAAQDLTLAGVLNLPAPTVTINSGANSLLLGDGNRDLFVGLGAGNLTSGAGDNTGLGYQSLQSVTSGNQNVAVGSYSLADNTTGIQNVGVGYLALQKNTVGFGNTAVGWESLKVNTTGWYDTGIGLWALAVNTTGNNNTAVGYNALGANTTGTENTALGVHADVGNTTGSNNVAVGWWSMNNLSDGVSNIAVGYQAGINLFGSDSGNIDIGNNGVGGESYTIRIGSVNNIDSNDVANTYIAGIWNTPVSSGLPVVVDSSGHLGVQPSSVSYGSGNTADGYQALNGNTSGIEDVAVGAMALTFNQNGGENTACGVSALQDNTSGSYNTAVGQGALAYNNSGTMNTAVGADALQQLNSGTGNIAIGAESGSQITGTANGDIDIGNMGEVGDNNIIRIGNPGTQTAAYIAGICYTDGYAGHEGTSGVGYDHSFNFWWDGSYLHAWVDTSDVGIVQGTSDRRLKENIQPMSDDALSRVMALKPSSFKYKNIPGTAFHGDGTRKEGFIADELQQVIPSAVIGQKDGLTSKGTIQPQTVNLMPVVAVLTKAVQDQQKEIDELKAMVKTLSEKK